MRAGVGWDEGVVGAASVGADLASPAGFALHTGKPVISNHLENEKRFRTPELLVEHGIRRAMNVILQGDGKPFGVLEVDSRSEGEFGEHDIAFLQGAANILGMAIERQLSSSKLKAALERHQVLLKEINHRVKNSLQVVAAMLRLQSSASGDAQLRESLAEASSRVPTVGRAYERLAYNADFETIELVAYIREVCADLDKEIAAVPVPPRGAGDNRVRDRPRNSGGARRQRTGAERRAARLSRSSRGNDLGLVTRAEPNILLVSVRDDGVGLPADFDPKKSKRLGALLVSALSKQLNAEMSAAPVHQGHQRHAAHPDGLTLTLRRSRALYCASPPRSFGVVTVQE